MIIEKTKHNCTVCNKKHDAQIVRKGKKVLFNYICKDKLKSIKISNDYGVFMHLRSYHKKTKFVKYNFKWFNMIELTNKCNYNCPICYASANEIDAKDFTIKEINNYLDKSSNRFICLSGGEPTLLPNFNEIIKNIKKKGLRTLLFTNGHSLGKNSLLAHSLKKSGLFAVAIQFDTFNPNLHLRIRGNDEIKIKKRAIDNCIKSKLWTGLISVILKQNLKEVKDILQYTKFKQPLINVIQFQPAVITGRFNYPKNERVYRDDIINEIIKSSIFKEVSLNSFFPYPKFNPWRANVHPDCGALLIIFKYKNRYIPLDKLCNIKKLYNHMHSNKMKSNIFTKNVVPIYYMLKSTPIKNYLKIFLTGLGTIFRSNKNRILFITINGYADEDYQDVNRINNCSNQVITKKREVKSPCQCG
tara:strand:- start:9664 stop:10908 length:1245 start_codon:yes stop_codon:yes gene_type:complete